MTSLRHHDDVTAALATLGDQASTWASQLQSGSLPQVSAMPEGLRVIFAMLVPLVPMIAFGFALVAWDAYLGPALFAQSFNLLDGLKAGATHASFGRRA